MSMAERLRTLPPVAEDALDCADPIALARTVEALRLRNELLAETLANVSEAWRLMRGETPGGVADILRACRVA